jgi:TonB family protein
MISEALVHRRRSILTPVAIACFFGCASQKSDVRSDSSKPSTVAEAKQFDESRARESRLLDAFEAAPAVGDAEGSRTRAKAMAQVAQLRFDRGEPDSALEAADVALRYARSTDDRDLVSFVHGERISFLRLTAVQRARKGDRKAAFKLLDLATADPDLTKDERQQIAGDRLVILDIPVSDSRKEPQPEMLIAPLIEIVGGESGEGTSSGKSAKGLREEESYTAMLERVEREELAQISARSKSSALPLGEKAEVVPQIDTRPKAEKKKAVLPPEVVLFDSPRARRPRPKEIAAADRPPPPKEPPDLGSRVGKAAPSLDPSRSGPEPAKPPKEEIARVEKPKEEKPAPAPKEDKREPERVALAPSTPPIERAQPQRSSAPVISSAAPTPLPETATPPKSPSLGAPQEIALASLPPVSDVPMTETGRLDRPTVQRVVKTHQRAVAACYDRSLRLGEKLTGRIEVEISVEPTGSITAAEVRTAHFATTELAKCVTTAIRRWRFPPFNGEAQRIAVPFLFSAPRY